MEYKMSADKKCPKCGGDIIFVYYEYENFERFECEECDYSVEAVV